MNLDNAMDIGLLPKIHKGKFVRYGNVALAGARNMLVSKLKRGETENLKSIITHLKPNEIEGENSQYLKSLRIYILIDFGNKI